MTSPEWLAADEDDADRFPQTSHTSAQISPHSPDEGSRVVPDPARVARYAEAIRGSDAWALPFVIAPRVMALADEERASLVELVREMGREAVTEAEAYRAVLARAEAAEAKVAKVEALADAVRALRARVHASKERGAAYDAWVLTDLLDSALEGHTCTDPNAECWACAVLADAPAEQRAEVCRCLLPRGHSGLHSCKHTEQRAEAPPNIGDTCCGQCPGDNCSGRGRTSERGA